MGIGRLLQTRCELCAGRTVANRCARRNGTCRAVRPISTGKPLDIGATPPQFLLKLLEAAIEMINAIDHRLAFASETRNHE
jgi:hypothetical protein